MKSYKSLFALDVGTHVAITVSRLAKRAAPPYILIRMGPVSWTYSTKYVLSDGLETLVLTIS